MKLREKLVSLSDISTSEDFAIKLIQQNDEITTVVSKYYKYLRVTGSELDIIEDIERSGILNPKFLNDLSSHFIQSTP